MDLSDLKQEVLNIRNTLMDQGVAFQEAGDAALSQIMANTNLTHPQQGGTAPLLTEQEFRAFIAEIDELMQRIRAESMGMESLPLPTAAHTPDFFEEYEPLLDNLDDDSLPANLSRWRNVNTGEVKIVYSNFDSEDVEEWVMEVLSPEEVERKLEDEFYLQQAVEDFRAGVDRYGVAGAQVGGMVEENEGDLDEVL